MANSLPNGVEKCTEYKNATGLDCLRCEEAYQVIYSGKYCSIYTLAETVEACVTLDRQFTSNNKKCSVSLLRPRFKMRSWPLSIDPREQSPRAVPAIDPREQSQRPITANSPREQSPRPIPASNSILLADVKLGERR